MKDQIKTALQEKIDQLQNNGQWAIFTTPDFDVERPKDFTHGDYTVNLGFILAKTVGKKPNEITEMLASDLEVVGIETIATQGGYINFTLTKEQREAIIEDVIEKGDRYGQNKCLAGKSVMVEYTDPNPFKVFHIGHLMPNVIGESLASLCAFSGADVIRANYQGDVGRHVAMALWGMQETASEMPQDDASLEEKTLYLGKCYAKGNVAFEQGDEAKAQIIALNRAVYEKTDTEINALYEKGRSWSLEKFEEIYAILGTKFDDYYFESETWEEGKRLVEMNTPSIFYESDGAIIYDGEKHGLHKRVFINSQGLTTYEAKDLGLAFEKKRRNNCDQYMIVTAVEQKPYFQVVFKAIQEIDQTFEGKLENVAHGMLQLTSGKMSSRTGNVISGVEMIEQAQEIARKKISLKSGDYTEELANQIAVSGIKFSILKQAIEKNSTYNPDEALSFEGDSGPYLQYTYVRTYSIMQKARDNSMEDGCEYQDEMREIVYLLDLFPETVIKAMRERAPHYVANYLLEVARAYNSFYANNQIISDDSESVARITLTKAVGHVIKNGLHTMGIHAPERM